MTIENLYVELKDANGGPLRQFTVPADTISAINIHPEIKDQLFQIVISPMFPDGEVYRPDPTVVT